MVTILFNLLWKKKQEKIDKNKPDIYKKKSKTKATKMTKTHNKIIKILIKMKMEK